MNVENTVFEPNTNHFPIIGIGSSAGGLKALECFFDNCPDNTGFAFVVIQHLSPDYKSLMSELLERHTQMIVMEVQKNEIIKPNHVYIIPGNKNIIIRKENLELTERAPQHKVNFSIDIFFKSLALERKREAICLVLSGTGSDGTKGATAVKKGGGTVFVQKPEDAKFDGMPKSAISSGLTDFVLSVAEMPNALIDFIEHHSQYADLSKEDIEKLESLNRILKMIKTFVGYDFLNYKKATLFRRTEKRMTVVNKNSIDEYINYLYEEPEEKFLLSKEYLIGVTRFFRDAEAFDEINQKVIPEIIKEKKGSIEPIKVWVVACSTGQEAYSIAMLLEEHLHNFKENVGYKIFATDINQSAIDIASKGIYDESVVSEIPQRFLEKYCFKKNDSFQIIQSVRSKMIFSKHDVLHNPPFGKMDLVSCRNMLIYMENEIQFKVLANIRFSLNQYGYLFLGSSENISLLDENIEEVNAKWRIYRNLKVGRLLSHNKDAWTIDKRRNSVGTLTKAKDNGSDPILKSINNMLIDDLGLVFACIDQYYEIIQASGKLKSFITIPEEGFTNNLIKMVPDELGVPLTSMIRSLNKGNENSAERTVKLLRENVLEEVQLIVKKLEIGAKVLRKKCYLVLLKVEKESVLSAEESKILPQVLNKSKELEGLKEALTETRENLQSTIEELESTGEEMQATNEELMASNEELQSTNEELQSLNEELHTVNAELQEKNVQLLESNSDIENLMKNVNIGTVFLDRNFNIRKFTPSINQHFQLRLEDIGRPINHFSGTLGGQDLMQLSKKVISLLQSHRQEVQNSEGTWFLMQIFPYRNQEHVIHGVVINFINIHETKLALQKTDQLNQFLSHITETNPGMIYIYDIVQKQTLYVNNNITKIAGYTEDEIKKLGPMLLPSILHKDDLERMKKHHQQMEHMLDGEILQIEYRIVHKRTKKPIWILSTDKVNERNNKGEVISILGVGQDISQSRDLQNQLKISESRLKLAIKGNRAAIWEWSDLGKNGSWWSKEFYELLGYTAETLKSKFSAFINLIHPEDVVAFRKSLEEHVENRMDIEESIRVKTSKNGYKWFRVNAKARINREGEVSKIVGTLADIDEKKEAENKMKELNVELERFAYLASHDLKEPLRTVTSFTKLFKEEYKHVFDDNANQYLDFIEKASARMITLTNDLLTYSQLDDKSLNFQKVDLNLLVQEIVQDLQKPIEDNKATITITELPHINCDKVQIRQLFQNLISNSLKYRKPKVKPIIEVGFEEKSTVYQFYIKDNGIGISQKYHAKIFEVFKRLHSNEEYEGTGIGLANCKRIVDNHKGRIWLRSSLGNGATFYFSIYKLNTPDKNEKDQLYSISG